MGSANCCKKPEEILIDEIKNNGEGDKINVLDQDSYPQDTEYVLKANMNPEEENISNQKLYEQEGSPRIDGAYEVAINESSPVQFKQVEISKQNDINTPVNENIEKEPQNLNQYSPEELAAYQNQNQIQRNANAYEEEIEQYNQPDDTPNKKNVEENNIIKQNQEVQQPNISNISNTGTVDLAVLTSQKSAAPINTLSQVVQTPLTNNKAINIQQNMAQPEQEINNQIQVKEPEEGEDLNKYFQIPTSLAKSKTTMPSNIGINDIQKLMQRNQGNVASVTPLEGNDDINKYFTQISTTQQNQNLSDKELLNKYFNHAVSGEINTQNITQNLKQPQTTTTTTVTKTTGNVDLRNIPTALTNSEIKRIVDMKDLPNTFGSNDIKNFNQKTTTTTTTTQTTGNLPKALTPEEIQKIINMKDLPETIGSSTMTNVKKTTVTTTTNVPGNNLNNSKPITTTTKTEITGSIPKALTQEEIQKIINMKDLPETIGSSSMTNVKKTIYTNTSSSPVNIDLKQFGLEQNPSMGPITSEPIDLKQFGLEPTKSAVSNIGNKQVTTVTKTVQKSGVPLTEDYSKYFQNIQTTNSNPIDLQQFGLENNASNISNLLQGSNITFKQPGQSLVSSNNNNQSTPIITNDYNQYFKTSNTITTTGNQRGVTNSTAVNPTYNYTFNTPYTKTATTTTTTKTTGIPVSSTTSYVTKNYTLPANYTTNKVTSTKVTKSTYGVPIQTTGYSYSYNIPTTTTTTTTIKK